MIDTEKFIKTISEGNKFLTSISHLHPMKIKGILEGVYEMYKDQSPEVLQDEYENYNVFDITYDNNGNITSASLKWNYYDSGEVRLVCAGIEVIYTPEHGSQKIIVKLPLELVKPYFPAGTC